MSFLDDDASTSGLSAEQIVEAMKGPSANGTATLDAASQAHADVHAGHVELETMTNSLIGTMTAAWHGDAADLAHSRIHPMVSTLRLSQDDLAKAKDLTSRQSGSFHDAANALVPVPPKPSNNILNVMTPFHTDLDSQIDQWNEAQSRNIAVYTSYTSASTYNHDGMPTSYGDVSTIGSPANVRIAEPEAPPLGPGPGGNYGPVERRGPDSNDHGPDSGAVNGPGTGGQQGPHIGQPPATGTNGQTPQPPVTGTGGQAAQPPVIPGGGSTTTQGYQDIPAQPTGPQWNQPGYNPAGGVSGGGAAGGVHSGGAAAAGGGAIAAGAGAFGAGSGEFGAGGVVRGSGGSSGSLGAGARGTQSGPGSRAGFGGQPSSGNRGGLSGQPGAGSRAGVSGMAGEPGATVLGKQGAPGQAGAPGMAPTGQAKKEEDKEHKSAAYLEDDYSDDIVGELPRTTPPVIGLD